MRGGGGNFFGGSFNTFVGDEAGQSNTEGEDNAFFGYRAGASNTTASFNSFFGGQSGSVSTGTSNSFFGALSGFNSTTGSNNSFFGFAAGFKNTSGNSNTFVGESAGENNTTGDGNVFVGRNSGASNTTENNNTFVGRAANGAAGITNATAIGANAQVTTSDTMVLGDGNAAFIVDVTGKLQIDVLGTAGSQQLCLNGSNRVAPCSSSLRYKSGVQRFNAGIQTVNRLQPITFTWNEGGMRDIGLAAEEVERVEPLLTFHNRNGQIEGVKYNQLSVLFINAFKEQQEQIAAHQKQIEKLDSIKAENASLKAQVADLLLRLERIELKLIQ